LTKPPTLAPTLILVFPPETHTHTHPLPATHKHTHASKHSYSHTAYPQLIKTYTQANTHIHFFHLPHAFPRMFPYSNLEFPFNSHPHQILHTTPTHHFKHYMSWYQVQPMQDCVRQISPQLDVQVCLRGMNTWNRSAKEKRQISPQLEVQECLRGINWNLYVDQVSQGKMSDQSRTGGPGAPARHELKSLYESGQQRQNVR